MCLEKLVNMHKDSVNLFLHLIALIVLVYSLWIHSMEGILIGVLIAVVGHIIEETKKKKKMKIKKSREKTKRKRKKGALEMSIGTIVIMVIAVTMLILGIVFVRSIMCAGIQMSEQLSGGVKDKIVDLFGADSYGVKCMGEGGQEVILGSGGRRPIACIIKVEEESEYEIKVKEIESIKGASKETVERWIIDKDWKGNANSGTDAGAVVVLLDIPRDAPTTTLKLNIESTNLGSSKKTTHILYIDIQPAGFFKTTMC